MIRKVLCTVLAKAPDFLNAVLLKHYSKIVLEHATEFVQGM
jgi:hypothetical protein